MWGRVPAHGSISMTACPLYVPRFDVQHFSDSICSISQSHTCIDCYNNVQRPLNNRIRILCTFTYSFLQFTQERTQPYKNTHDFFLIFFLFVTAATATAADCLPHTNIIWNIYTFYIWVSVHVRIVIFYRYDECVRITHAAELLCTGLILVFCVFFTQKMCMWHGQKSVCVWLGKSVCQCVSMSVACV